MSPEQTGRTNSLVDKTSDIYSLGMTFYHLLVGKTPFHGEPAHVIYSQIAKEPPKIQTSIPEVPDCLEGLIQKMIKKNQSDRYRSVIGVKKELEFIKKNLKNESLLKDYVPGQFDVNDIFSFENKLYGRDKEVEVLMKNLKNVQENNLVEINMISGTSGVGKSV
jgi:serine/threonine protein kinase